MTHQGILDSVRVFNQNPRALLDASRDVRRWLCQSADDWSSTMTNRPPTEFFETAFALTAWADHARLDGAGAVRRAAELIRVKAFPNLRSGYRPATQDQIDVAVRRALDVLDRIDAAALLAMEKPATKTSDGRTAEQRVRDTIAAMLEAGVPAEKITRDAVAHKAGISAGAVSQSQPWKALAAEKQRAKLPGTPDERLIAAAKRKDWGEAERLQHADERGQDRTRNRR